MKCEFKAFISFYNIRRIEQFQSVYWTQLEVLNNSLAIKRVIGRSN